MMPQEAKEHEDDEDEKYIMNIEIYIMEIMYYD
jgi:hypothetical protein